MIFFIIQNGCRVTEASAGDTLSVQAADAGGRRHQDGAPVLRRVRGQRPLPDLLPPRL